MPRPADPKRGGADRSTLPPLLRRRLIQIAAALAIAAAILFAAILYVYR